MRGALLVCLLAIAALTGCSLFKGSRPSATDSRLQVQMTDLATTAHSARIRGTVTSHYSERVDGVRYVVTVRDKEEPPNIVERAERQVDTAIEPGGQAPVDVTVQGQHFTDKKLRIAITASPVSLGGKAVPPPEGWTEN